MKKICVIGIGSPLRSDDGIGIILLEKLIEKKSLLPKEIEFINGGTSGMNLVHILARFDIVLIIDAVQLNAAPGAYRLFTEDEIVTNKDDFFISTHENKLPQVIKMSKQLGELPEQLFIFGIQPKDVSYGTALSEDLRSKTESILRALKKEIIKIIDANKLGQ